MSTAPNWIRDAEAALAEGSSPNDDCDVVDVSAPALLDASGARALLAPFLAAFMWAAVVFREMQMNSPLDALALGFRVLALALTLRALRVLYGLWLRLRMSLARKQYGLVLTPGGLLYRSPSGGDVVVPREEILDVREHGATALAARATWRWAEVYVVTHPDSPRLYLALPPLFARGPRALAELLMRWRGVADPAEQSLPSENPEAMPSRLWERAGAGEALPGVVGIKHGYGWVARGPYASLLLGIAVLDGFIRLPASAQHTLNPTPALFLAAVLVVVPIVWFVLTRAQMSSRKGLALVLAPQDLLLRGRGGITRAPWSSVSRCEVTSRTTWSLLQGAHDSRALLVQRTNESSLQCNEAAMAAPAEVVASLCEFYRKRSAAK